MIDKQTINKESFLLILPKVRPVMLRKSKDVSMKAAKWVYAFILAIVTVGGISMIIDSSYIDIDEFISASLLIPTQVLEWIRAIDLYYFVNQITLPFLVMALFIFLVVKLVRPSKE